MRPTEDQIVLAVSMHFNTFGGSRDSSEYNPLVKAFRNKQPMFALGVDVREVVQFVTKALQLEVPAEWSDLMDKVKA
jgi:hypothetical protein